MKAEEFTNFVKDQTLILSLFALLLLIAPGLTAIHVYSPSLIQNLDWVKLILVALCFTAPVVVFNSFIIAIIDNKEVGETLFASFIGATAMSALIIYLVLAGNFYLNYFGYHLGALPHGNELLLGLFAEICFALSVWNEARRDRQNR